MVLAVILIGLTSIYTYQIFRYYRGLFYLKQGKNTIEYTVSVIIPVRNEASHIAACLKTIVTQNYPMEKVEILVVNDQSTDQTADIVKIFTESYKNVRILNIEEKADIVSPKKRAISEGIKNTHNELILTVDGDCMVPPNWLKTMVSYFESDVGVVCGSVLLDCKREMCLFEKIQSLEFLSIIIAGMGSMALGDPIIANGANLAYRRNVYTQINGFQGIDNLVSGDDDLFIQKVARLTQWKICAAFDVKSTVRTEPVPDLRTFLNQRSRWASKGVYYQNPFLILYLISVYFFYGLLFIFVPYSIIHGNFFSVPIIMFCIKAVVDYVLLSKGTKIIQQNSFIRYHLLAEIFQILYILFVGIAGLLGKFKWKGR